MLTTHDIPVLCKAVIRKKLVDRNLQRTTQHKTPILNTYRNIEFLKNIRVSIYDYLLVMVI